MVRLRRRGFSPLSVPGLALWFKADAGTWQDSALTTPAAADGDVVGGWVDQSASAHALVQATTSKKPTLKTGANGINGLPVVRGDGVDDYLKKATQVLTGSTGTILSVFRLTAGFASTTLVGQGDEATGLNSGVGVRTTKIRTYVGPNTVQANTVLVANTAYLGVFESTGAAYRFMLDGTTEDTPYSVVLGANDGYWFGDEAGIDNVTLFARERSDGPDIFHKGDIAELIAYGSQVSSGDLASLVAYLQTRWGL
jgi:hypothetical protein